MVSSIFGFKYMNSTVAITVTESGFTKLVFFNKEEIRMSGRVLKDNNAIFFIFGHGLKNLLQSLLSI